MLSLLLITQFFVQREEEEDEKRLKHLVMVEGVCRHAAITSMGTSHAIFIATAQEPLRFHGRNHQSVVRGDGFKCIRPCLPFPRNLRHTLRLWATCRNSLPQRVSGCATAPAEQSKGYRSYGCGYEAQARR